MAQSPEVEILVHITAQSRAIDDSRYRSLASAYLDFEPAANLPVSSTSLASSSAGSSDHEPQISQQQASQDNNQHDSRLSGHVMLLESPIASFRSVLDNANSPRPVTRHKAQLSQANSGIIQSQVTQNTWQSPPSMVEDSIPQNNAMATIFTSPTRVLEHYLQTFDSPSQTHTRSSGGNSEQIIAVTPIQQRRDSHDSEEKSHQKQLSATIVPRTPFQAAPGQLGKYIDHQFAKNKHAISHDIKDTPFDSSQTSGEDIEETVLISSLEIPSAGRADSEPLPNRRVQKMVADSSPPQLARTSSDSGPNRPGKKATVITINFLPSHGFKYESLELYAPEPPVSTSRVEPHNFITPNLDSLAKSLETEKPFRPKEQTRDLRPTERGYWLLDCTTWNAKLRRDAWAFLANYIGTGAAGWGVSCRRDADFLWVRTYCWGTVVPHLYFLLYLATQREVLFTGASWIDGDEKTVIVMGTREHR